MPGRLPMRKIRDVLRLTAAGMVDIGTGSGILALAAARAGAPNMWWPPTSTRMRL